jgi:hypothetical protein
MGQAGRDGSFRIHSLPRQTELRLCALYDIDRNRAYDPADDLWGCLEEPLSFDDTTRVQAGIEVYLVLPDEPGSIEGAAIDSSCIGTGVELLRQLATETDSLLFLIGEGSTVAADTLLGFDRAKPPDVDTSAVRARLARIDSVRSGALEDSARCSTPVVVRLLDRDSTLVEESRGTGAFTFGQITPGIYRIVGFRDLDGDGLPGFLEPIGAVSDSVELRPGREIKDLNFYLRSVP